MNEKGANIDLLFRNGLKDYEVLPPPGVWDGVNSTIRHKSHQYAFLRIAAVIMVLIGLSFLTFRLGRELTAPDAGRIMAFDLPASSPVIIVTADKISNLPAKKSNQVINTPVVLNPNENLAEAGEQIIPSESPLQIMNFRETRNLSIAKSEPLEILFHTPLNSSGTASAKIKFADLQYSPDIVPAKPVKKWSVTAMASPTYYSGFGSGTDGLSKELANSEQALISYSGGVAFSYKISRRFTIQSGVYYSSLGQKLDGINSYSGFAPYGSAKGDHNFEVLTTTGIIYASNPDVFLSADGAGRIITQYSSEVFDPKKASLQPVNTSLNQNFSYLELPVVLRYKLVDKTIGINLIGGLSYNMLVHNSVYTTIGGNKYPVGDTKGLNPLTLSSSLGMGMEYNFSDKLSLNLEPTFRYYLNPFSITTGSFVHPYSFGIFSGVSYKF
jgi:hypothetical protein